MRILYILRNAEGGIRAHVETLMKGALARGHEPLLITDLTQADKSFLRAIAEDPELRKRIVSISMRSAPGPWDLTTLWLLYIGLRSTRSAGGAAFDVVHGHGAKGGVFARLARKLRLIPKTTRVVYTPHGGSLHKMHGSIMNWIYPVIEKWLAKSTDLILFESRYTQDEFNNRIGSTIPRLLLNRNGIAPLEPNLLPWPPGLGTIEPVRVGAFGMLREIKGFDILISAVKLVLERGFSLTLDISGEGNDREKLVTLIRDLNVEAGVFVHRETSNAVQKMLKCDIIVQPSIFESFGLVALEAQALGRAVIASRVGGLVDIVEDQFTGLLVPPSDPTALADAIVWMLEHPDEVLGMRTRGARRAREQFSAEKMIDGAFTAYRLLENPKKPDFPEAIT